MNTNRIFSTDIWEYKEFFLLPWTKKTHTKKVYKCLKKKKAKINRNTNIGHNLF